jgi:hypothetical protein
MGESSSLRVLGQKGILASILTVCLWALPVLVATPFVHESGNSVGLEVSPESSSGLAGDWDHVCSGLE